MEVEINCPVEDCLKQFDVFLEDEELAEGRENQATCPNCGADIAYQISWSVSAIFEEVANEPQ